MALQHPAQVLLFSGKSAPAALVPCPCWVISLPSHVRAVCWAGGTDSAHEVLWDWKEVLEHPAMARDRSCCQ